MRQLPDGFEDTNTCSEDKAAVINAANILNDGTLDSVVDPDGRVTEWCIELVDGNIVLRPSFVN